MKRWVIIITICILIGAIINVLVAWGIGLRSDHTMPTSKNDSGASFDGPGYDEWLVNKTTSKSITIIISQAFGKRIENEKRRTAEEILPYWAEIVRPNPDETPTDPYSLKSAVAYGWPLRSMILSAGEDSKELKNNSLGLEWDAPMWIRVEPRIQRLTPYTGPIRLPLNIIWPGFIANTLLYAMVPFLLFTMKFKLRGYLRIKRKQCTKCGYPIGQSRICTECGAVLITHPS